MHFLSFRVIYLCIILPPILYVFSVQGLEMLIQKRWSAELRRTIISDIAPLLSEEVTIESDFHRAVHTFLSNRKLVRWGVRPEITITTRAGIMLYPIMMFSPADPDILKPPLLLPEATAARNRKILQDGFIVNLGIEIPHNTWVANGVLLFHLLMVSGLLARVYVARTSEAERLSRANAEALEKARVELLRSQQKLERLTAEEKNQRERIALLHSELHKAKDRLESSEHEALTEIEALEKSLKESTALREAMEPQVTKLREEVTRLTVSAQRFGKKREKQVQGLTKRLGTLYKKIQFNERAVQGFQDLEADMQLKAEEVIHNLNEDCRKIPVKRKVFSGKGTLSVVESEFAHRGRIYWRRSAGGKVEILVIGTKNTQGRDLAHLESLN